MIYNFTLTYVFNMLIRFTEDLTIYIYILGGNCSYYSHCGRKGLHGNTYSCLYITKASLRHSHVENRKEPKRSIRFIDESVNSLPYVLDVLMVRVSVKTSLKSSTFLYL